jgi:hypothetical protein
MLRINIKRVGAVLFVIAGVITLGNSKTSKLHASSQGCTNAILKGGYGAGTTGLINSSSNPNDVTIPTFVPFAEAAHFSFDGAGNLSGTSTADYGGSSFPVVFNGSYSVNSNCTGNMTVDAGVNGIVHRDLVLVDGGKEVNFVDTDPGFVIAGSMKKQQTEE